MVITNHLPTATSGRNDITSKNLYFAGKQQKQGGVQRSASKMEIDWENSKGTDGACFHCGHPGHVAAKCIANMPQEVKDYIVSDTAPAARKDESDESENNDTTKIVTFSRHNPCMFSLMANTLICS